MGKAYFSFETKVDEDKFTVFAIEMDKSISSINCVNLVQAEIHFSLYTYFQAPSTELV